MKKLGKIVPALLLALTLSTLAACGCGETGQNESNMVENTTEIPSPQTETENTAPPVVEDPTPSDVSGNETDMAPDMNGGNSTAVDDGILDDAGNAVGDMIDGAGNAVNDAVDGITEGVDDMTGNTGKTTR